MPATQNEEAPMICMSCTPPAEEAGHPTHCGDWLAETLNDICLNKEGVNLELFEGICGLNGVDTAKYKRSGVGWQSVLVIG